MKRILLSIFALTTIYDASSQILQSENFDSLPIGPVGTDATGTIPTNNYYTLSTNYDLDPLAATTGTNASADNFQIIDYGEGRGTVLQIEGTNGDKGRRNMWQAGLADQWAFRDAGKDKILVEFDLFTGAGGGESNNSKGLYIYDATTTPTALKILGGYVFNTKTLVLQGIGYYTSPTSTANWGFFLGTGGTANLILPANQWVRLAITFDKASGQIVWKGPGFTGQVNGAAPDSDPDKVALVSRSGSAAANGPTPAIVNAAATTDGLFDNLVVTATDINLLDVNEIYPTVSSVTAFPNPAKDFIYVTGNDSNAISSVILTDLNGRIVKSQTYGLESNIEMNISDLSNGVYLMKITSENGSSIQKIMKN